MGYETFGPHSQQFFSKSHKNDFVIFSQKRREAPTILKCICFRRKASLFEFQENFNIFCEDFFKSPRSVDFLYLF